MDLNEDIRESVLSASKRFKAGWVELGRILYTVYKDKLYKNWGYEEFENYAVKEVGVRKNTALKLIRSYYFLEENEPLYLKRKYSEDSEEQVPECDAVDILRRAKKNKEVKEEDYRKLREAVFDKIVPPTEVRKELTAIIKNSENKSPEEAREERRIKNIKRLLTVLKSIREEVKSSKLLPAKTVELVDKVVGEVEANID